MVMPSTSTSLACSSSKIACKLEPAGPKASWSMMTMRLGISALGVAAVAAGQTQQMASVAAMRAYKAWRISAYPMLAFAASMSDLMSAFLLTTDHYLSCTYASSMVE